MRQAFAALALAPALLAVSAAQAAGVNDTLPNGQQQIYAPTYQPSQSTATPNRSADYYRWQLYQPPVRRLHRIPRHRTR